MATATIEAHRHATAYTRLQLRHSVVGRDSCRRSAGIGCSFTRFANDHRFHSRVIDCLGSVTFERDAKSGSPSDRIHTRFFETHAFPCADEAGINRLVRRGLRRTWRLVFIRTEGDKTATDVGGTDIIRPRIDHAAAAENDGAGPLD